VAAIPRSGHGVPRAGPGDQLLGRSGHVGGVPANDWNEAGPVLMVEGWPVRLAAVLTQEANTVVVTGSNQRGMTLLVVPSGMPGGAARACWGGGRRGHRGARRPAP
jgi:hypothetical protein